MSSTITAARQRRSLLASSFLVPIVSLGISAAHAQQAARRTIAADRGHRANRPEPDPRQDRPTMKDRRRAVSCRPLRRRPPRARSGDRRERRIEGGRLRRRGNGGRQFPGIVGTSSTVITAEEIAHSPAQTLQEIIAQVPGVQLTSLCLAASTAPRPSVDLRGFGAFATCQYPGPDQRPPAQRHRHGTASISRPFRAIRSSASKSRAATAARCCTATTRSAASSTSS